MHSEIVELVLVPLFAAWCVTIVFSWWIHIPYFRRLLQQLEPAEHQRTGGWTVTSSSQAGAVCVYFLKRQYLRSDVNRIRRHGRILRWTFSIPVVVGVFALPAALVAEGIARAR